MRTTRVPTIGGMLVIYLGFCTSGETSLMHILLELCGTGVSTVFVD